MKVNKKYLDEIGKANLRSEVAEPIYNTEELMDLLKVSRRTLQDWRDKGLIEFSAIRGKFYYRYSAVVKMLDNHTIKPF